MTTGLVPVTIERASTLSRVLQLDLVSFTAIEARRLGVPSPDSKLQWDLPVVEVAWQSGNGQLNVHLPFVLHVFDSATKAPIYELLVSVLVNYRVREGAQIIEENCRDFAGINGFLHAWPYLRAETQSLSTKLSFPPLTLPSIVVDVVPPRVRVGDPVPTMATPVDTPAPDDVPSTTRPRTAKRRSNKLKA